MRKLHETVRFWPPALSRQRTVGLLDVVLDKATSPSVDLFVLSAILKGSSVLDASTSGSVDRFLLSPAKNHRAENCSVLSVSAERRKMHWKQRSKVKTPVLFLSRTMWAACSREQQLTSMRGGCIACLHASIAFAAPVYFRLQEARLFNG